MEHNQKLVKVSSCALCGSEKHTQYLKCKDHSVSGEIFQLMVCQACGLVFTSPRPSLEALPNYYQSSEYISHSDDAPGLINFVYKKVRAISLQNKLKIISKLAPPSESSLLDYGCGTGAFIESAKKAGWKVAGIEPDSGARKQAEAKCGLEIYLPDDIQRFEQSSVSVITLWHVLEHVENPGPLLSEFFRILKPEGYLLLALPNYDSLDAIHYRENWAAFDVPRHLFHYDQRSIKKLAKMSGFELFQIVPMKFDAYYISWLSEKYRGNWFAPIKGVIFGFRSNQYAARNPQKGYSSQLYILKK